MRFIINIIILLLTENTLNSQRLQINEIRLQSVEFVFKASTDCLKKSIIIKLFELYSFLFSFFFLPPYYYHCYRSTYTINTLTVWY